MAKNIRDTFVNIMENENMECIPECPLEYGDNFRFSSILNIKEKFNRFFYENRKMYTVQKAVRTTDKILDIVGKEGVASPLTYMMSFFLMKEDSLKYSFDLSFRFFEGIGININDIIIVLSDDMLKEISKYTKISNKITIVDKDSLATNLGEIDLKGEYIKFYFKNFNGLVPIGTLNIIKSNDLYIVDSSFILECNLVASTFANSIYNTDIFCKSYKLVSTWDNTISKILKYRILNFSRFIFICLYNDILPGSKGRNYTIKKLLRSLICDIYLSIIKYYEKCDEYIFIKLKFYSLIDMMSEDLLLLEKNIDLTRKEDIKKILDYEIREYVKLLIQAKDIIKSKSYSDKRMIEEKGIPKKLIDFYNGKKEIESTKIPMNPIFENIELKTDMWIKKIHK